MKFIKIRDVKSPNRGTPKSAGVDFFIPQDFPQTVINPGKSVLIPSGIKMNVPHEHVFIAHNKCENIEYNDINSLDQNTIFDHQLNKYIKVFNQVAVLSAFPFFIIEYFGEEEFNLLDK